MLYQFTLLILGSVIGCALATWSMTGYACQQPQLYNQCQCPSLCSGYGNGYTYIYPQYRDQISEYQEFVRTHKPKPRKPKIHHKKKFHFSEEKIEEKHSSLEDFDSSEFKQVATEATTERARTTTNSWDNEDLWEKKFVKTKTGDEDEFPEITSAEIEAARVRPNPQPQPVQPVPSNGGGGIGPIGIGGGVGVGGIGVNTGLGITAPGVGGGGLGGLGTGGLVGVNSGLGIGIPGVGPIGVSSGLGIGK